MDRQAFDVVIPYKKGRSTEELRFCLRSVEKNLPFIGRVFIIGELPEWASDEIIHIPSEQRHEKSANVAVSHRIAANDERISDNFVLMNDDMFIMRELQEIPLWHGTPLSEFFTLFGTRVPRSYYTDLIKRALSIVRHDLPHWELHIPIVLNKSKFKHVLDLIEGMHMMSRTIYGSLYLHGKGEYHQDVKIYQVSGSKNWQDMPRFDTFVSSDDSTFEHVIMPILAKMFPTKSKYEL